MGIREKLEKKKPLVVAIASLAIVAAALYMIWYLYPRHHKPAGAENYFTDDDGATWFTDDATKLPPFSHGGKEAVLARMYQTSDGKPFVGYLEKYTDEGKARVGSVKTATPKKVSARAVNIGDVQSSGLLLKKPKDPTWVPEEDPAAAAVRTVTAPDGSKDFLPITPE